MPGQSVQLTALKRAVDERRAAGRGLPCDDDERFTADSPDKRREVVGICAEHCHLRALCSAAGRYEKWGIWGGIDRSAPPITQTRTTKRKDSTT